MEELVSCKIIFCTVNIILTVRYVLSQGVATINAEIRTRYVAGSITQEEGNSTHQVFWGTHLACGNQGDPLVAEVRIFLEDLPSTNIH